MSIAFFRMLNQNSLIVRSYNYNTAHDAASGPDTSYLGPCNARLPFEDERRYDIRRAFIYSDTAALEGKTLTAVRLILRYNQCGECTLGYATMHIVEGVQHIPLIGTDYGDELSKTISGGSITCAELLSQIESLGYLAYISVPLNPTGLAWINLSGITKFCFRLISDINAWIPTCQPIYVLSYYNNYVMGAATKTATYVDKRIAYLNGTHRGGTQQASYLEVTYDGEYSPE